VLKSGDDFKSGKVRQKNILHTLYVKCSNFSCIRAPPSM
jgi:hypothetical protein